MQRENGQADYNIGLILGLSITVILIAAVVAKVYKTKRS